MPNRPSLLALACVVCVAPPAAPQATDWRLWDSVDRISGQATTECFADRRRDDGFDREVAESRETATLRFELERQPPRGVYTGSTHWQAVRVQVSGERSSSRSSSSTTSRQSYSETGSFSQELRDFENSVRLTLHWDSGRWQLLLPEQLEEPFELDVEWSQWSTAHSESGSDTTTSSSFCNVVFDGIAPSRIGTLTTDHEHMNHEEDGSGSSGKRGRATLQPGPSDVELSVTIDGYDDWRPLGSIDNPAAAGNHLVARAVLRPKIGRESAAPPEVEKLVFELIGTSSEPGVTMNWPLGASDEEPDLRLAIEPSSPGPVGERGQSLEVPDPPAGAGGWPWAAARIESFDFGGTSELRVVAVLEDGRLIDGRLEGGAAASGEILIPKRRPGTWIADAWRAAKQVGQLADNDDSEDEPAGDGDQGDGFTLYEEYRGFAMRRSGEKRVEGDPKRKDFFILNLIGADAWPGIQMFEDATRLRVHRLLDPSEMSVELRVMNGNHRDSAHLVDQHGVVVRTLTREKMGHRGAEAFVLASGHFAAKPATVEHVGMPSRNDPDSDAAKPWNLAAADLVTAFDMTLVHELLHTIGVDHHGQGDYSLRFRYLPAVYWANASKGQMYVVASPLWRPVEIREEATGANWADRIGPAFEAIFDNIVRAHVAEANLPPGTRFADLDQQTKNDLVYLLPEFHWQIGVENGQHSGNEQCPMRYGFAQAYPAHRPRQGPAVPQSSAPHEIYYLVPPGSEDIGIEICTARGGTGVNSPNRAPQSRYGDAAENFGNCAAQICVNDAVPPHDMGVERAKR